MKEDFSQILKQHMKRYPLMEPQDFGKLVFQSTFGPEHMISDKEQAEAFLIEEWKTLSKEKEEMSEPVSASLCRFPLSACGSIEEAKLLARLFIATAKEHKGTVEELEKKVEQLRDLHISGMEEWIAAWKQKGYPPVHHSAVYRERYHPHYRLIKKEYTDYFQKI